MYLFFRYTLIHKYLALCYNCLQYVVQKYAAEAWSLNTMWPRCVYQPRFVEVYSMTFAQWRNHLMMYFSEWILIVKGRLTLTASGFIILFTLPMGKGFMPYFLLCSWKCLSRMLNHSNFTTVYCTDILQCLLKLLGGKHHTKLSFQYAKMIDSAHILAVIFTSGYL